MTDLSSGEARTRDKQPAGRITGVRSATPQPSWSPTAASWVRRAAAQVTPAALWHRHRLFTVAVLVSLIPRIFATLGFRPALLIQDSFSYMYYGVHLAPGPLRPSGYPMMLLVLEPLHSLLAVTTVQHLLGLGIAVIIYGLLRSRGLPAWGATLAAGPTLFDPRMIWEEMSILPDVLFMAVTVVAVALLLTKRTPRPWQTGLAGLLVAWASVIRGNGVFIVIPILIFLAIRRVGWRAVGAFGAALVIPLLGYMAVFYQSTGQFDLTDSTGIFLWARTMSFANCSIIKPPRDLLPLCPNRQPDHPTHPAPAWSVSALLDERSAPEYQWDPGVWYAHDAHPGFNAYNNKLAEQFDIRAIEAQPLAYLKTIGKGVMLTFLDTDRSQSYLALSFTTKPHVPKLSGYQRRDEELYAHTTSNTHPVQPWAFFMFLYQEPVYFTGIAFFLVMLVGLLALIWNWRRLGRFALLPWGVAFINLVVPVALSGRDYRYAISAVPFACLAAAMAFGRATHRRPVAAGVPVDGAGRAVTAGGAVVGGSVSDTPDVAEPPSMRLLDGPAARETAWGGGGGGHGVRADPADVSRERGGPAGSADAGAGEPQDGN